MKIYSVDQAIKMLPLLKHYSWFIEDLYSRLEVLNDKIIDAKTGSLKTQKTPKSSTESLDDLTYNFNIIEDRLFELVHDLWELDIKVCSPVFGAMDILVRTRSGKLAYLCFDHSVDGEDEFLCHKIYDNMKTLNLSRYCDC